MVSDLLLMNNHFLRGGMEGDKWAKAHSLLRVGVSHNAYYLII